MPHPSPVDRAVVDRRIRNRQIEWLESVAPGEDGPSTLDLDELVNQWFDWNPDEPDASAWPPPAWTADEAACLAAVARALDAFCTVTPQVIGDDAGAWARPEWAAVRAAAGGALAEMSRRGRLAED